MTKTREEVEAFKKNWHNDPCWDIEDTEGFEEYRGELLEYGKACSRKWAEQAFKERMSKADEMGLLTNLKLVNYIIKLEQRIERLEGKQ